MYGDDSIEITMQKQSEQKPLTQEYNSNLNQGTREITDGKGLNQSPGKVAIN